MAKFERVAVSKEMFAEAKESGLALTDVLKKKSEAEGKFVKDSSLNALEQQLAARDLAIAPGHASLVSDFYATEENKVLFVESINQAVKIGMNQLNKSFASLADVVATRTGIDSGSYDSAEVDLTDANAKKISRVTESAEFPKVRIKFKNTAIKLAKFGYSLEASYEAIRRIRANVFLLSMQVLGQNIARQKLAWAIDTLVNGDGNANPIQSMNALVNGTLSYRDVVNLEESFDNYEPSLLLASTDMRAAYRNLDEYKNRGYGPVMMDPPKKVKTLANGTILALDAKACLEEVYEKGGSLVEYDKVINKQLENAVVSEIAGYAVLFRDAARQLRVSY